MEETHNNNQKIVDESAEAEKFFKLKGETLVIIDWANVYGWFEKLGWEVGIQKLYDYLNNYPEICGIRFYFGVERGNKKSEEFQEAVRGVGYTLVSKEVKWVPVSLGKSHFKNLVKELFDVLDEIKDTNSEISKKLYELINKINRMVDDTSVMTPNADAGYAIFNKDQLEDIYESIGLLDKELRKLNISIDGVQNNLQRPVKRRKCDFDCEISLDVMNSLENIDGLILFSGDGDYKIIAEYLLDNKKQVIVVHPFGVRGREYNELLEREGYRPYLCAVEKLTQLIKL